MNEKLRPPAVAILVGREAHEQVTLKLRITTPFSPEEVHRLTAWGAVLKYDSGIMAVVVIPAGRACDLAEFETVQEII